MVLLSMETRGTIRCCRCPRKGLTVNDFAGGGLRKLKRQPNTRSGVCKVCIAAHNKQYYALNADRERKRAKEKHLREKRIVVDHYGGCCTCCDELELVFLQIDHIENDGAAHRKACKVTGSSIIWWLIKNNFPPGFQILCANCHQAKTAGVTCPHKLSKSSC